MPPEILTSWERSGCVAGPARTLPSRTSKDAPCNGQTSRSPRKRPSLILLKACVQILSSANTFPSRVWQITSSRSPTCTARIEPRRNSDRGNARTKAAELIAATGAFPDKACRPLRRLCELKMQELSALGHLVSSGIAV